MATPQQLVEAGIGASRSPECIVIAEAGTSANLRWANNMLTTNGVMHGLDITIIAVRDGAAASVSGTATTLDHVRDLVGRADAEAADADPAEDRQPLVGRRESDDWGEPPAGTKIGIFSDFAGQLGDEFRRAGSARQVLYGFVQHDVVTTYLGSSTGLRLRHVQPTGHYACTGKPEDLSTSAWVGGATADFAGVDAHEMGRELTRRIGWATRRVELPAGRYDTILPPTAVADLMIDAYWSAGARVAADGQSVFSKPGGGIRVGDRIARETVSMRSDPSYAGLEAAPFVIAGGSSNETSVFDNGLPLAPTDWIREGTLASLIQTRHSAALTGQPVTPGIDNLVVEVAGATGTQEDLVAGVERGLLLTCLWYIREVDPQTLLLTGLTRDGVYLIEGGEVTGTVNNFRFNESPVDLLRRFSGASQTVRSFSREWGDDYFNRTATPALRVPDFNMSSVSPAT